MLVDLLFALVIALFFTLVFAVMGRKARKRQYLIMFFLIVFFAAWAGGIWITPIGPTILGVYWVSFFTAGLIFALVLEAVAAFSSRSTEAREEDIRKEEETIETAAGTTFWILLLALIITIIIGYVHNIH